MLANKWCGVSKVETLGLEKVIVQV